MKLTEKRYVEILGTCCPRCESDQIEGSNIQIDGGNAYQPIYCPDCDFVWDDVYELRGIVLDSSATDEERTELYKEPFTND
jgi:hypothetical protein